jgi:hypothetical protein
VGILTKKHAVSFAMSLRIGNVWIINMNRSLHDSL